METNFIDFSNSNLFADPSSRGKINRIMVYYKNPPTLNLPTQKDKIDFTITWKDDEEDASGTFTCASITAATSSPNRAIVEDIGVVCSRFSLRGLITAGIPVVPPNTWNLIIDKIVVDWTPISGNS